MNKEDVKIRLLNELIRLLSAAVSWNVSEISEFFPEEIREGFGDDLCGVVAVRTSTSWQGKHPATILILVQYGEGNTFNEEASYTVLCSPLPLSADLSTPRAVGAFKRFLADGGWKEMEVASTIQEETSLCELWGWLSGRADRLKPSRVQSFQDAWLYVGREQR